MWAVALGEVNDLSPSGTAVLRLVFAALLGAVIGFEREVTDQPAGLRTHITVSLGAAVFGVVSTIGFSEFVTDQRAVNIQFDVTRVASQVVVGIGFLGAGVIFRAGSTVRNLTTAASLWVTAAVGLSAGVGDVGVAAVGTGALVAALLLLRWPKNLIRRRITRARTRVSIRLARIEDADAVLGAVEAVDGVHIVRRGWGKVGGDPVMELTLVGDPDVEPDAQLREIVARSDVLGLKSETSHRMSLTEE